MEQSTVVVGCEFVNHLITDTENARAFVILESLFLWSSELNGEVECCDDSVPGAVSVHPSYFEEGSDASRYYPHYHFPRDNGNLLPDSELHRCIADLGITEDTLVVVYGKGRITAMSAARVAWALMYAGVKDVKLLDGGFPAWLNGGYPTARATAPTKVEAFNKTGGVASHVLATTAEVAAVVEDPVGTTVLVDVRRLGEYDGSTPDCYPFFSAAGHIPSAIFHDDWLELVKDANTLRDLDAVKGHWEQCIGGVANGDKTLIFYCGTGWRSALAFVLALQMGVPAKNYDGGFYEWWGLGHQIVRGNV